MRTVRLALGEQDAATSTELVVAAPRAHMTLRLHGDIEDVRTENVDAHDVADGVVHLDGVGAGARISVQGRVAYAERTHGLARFVDPADGRVYVVASGALGGAPRFVACEDGPADRLPTTLVVSGLEGRTVATGAATDAPGHFVSHLPLASHHLALAAGPWRRYADGAVAVLARQSLARHDEVAALALHTARALAWVAEWFRGSAPALGSAYTQVLLPDPPWSAMEHPGCVLVSERLLDVDSAVSRGRRTAVLAHEAAHQWLGNLVSPRGWGDVAVFEGLAELVGQLACEALLGRAARPYLDRRRAAGPLVVASIAPDAGTAGLAEVAGPVQHAELFRQVRSELGARAFQDRVRALCRTHVGMAVSAADVWSALGVEPRASAALRLPTTDLGPGGEPWLGLSGLDPATAVVRTREAFRKTPLGRARVRAALAAMRDPRVSPAVVAGLGAELALGFAGVQHVAAEKIRTDLALRSNHQTQFVISISSTD